MASVTFDNATRLYPGGTRPAVDKLNLEVADGEFLVLVGPSGCGKSTSLRMLAGLEEVNSGRILIGDRDVTDIPPKDRDIAMVFQNYALYPHMTVAENMGFALKIAGVGKEERAQRVLEAAKLLDLEEYLTRKPKALSGGQRQRVAMGRAIVRQPQVFLMDEPLSNLDAKLRVQTRTQIASLQRRLGVTTVYVTHDQTEALTMGDRIAVLKDGLLQQVGTPRDLYEKPSNVFVAGFIGSPAMNLFPVDLASAGGIQHGTAVVDADIDKPRAPRRSPPVCVPRTSSSTPPTARASRSRSTSSRSSARTATSTATPRSTASAPTSSRASMAAATRTPARPWSWPPCRTTCTRSTSSRRAPHQEGDRLGLIRHRHDAGGPRYPGPPRRVISDPHDIGSRTWPTRSASPPAASTRACWPYPGRLRSTSGTAIISCHCRRGSRATSCGSRTCRAASSPSRRRPVRWRAASTRCSECSRASTSRASSASP